MLHLTESDLRFLVETVATSRRDYDHIVDLVRDKEDLLEVMLEDPKLTERILREDNGNRSSERSLKNSLWLGCGAQQLERALCQNASLAIFPFPDIALSPNCCWIGPYRRPHHSARLARIRRIRETSETLRPSPSLLSLNLPKHPCLQQKRFLLHDAIAGRRQPTGWNCGVSGNGQPDVGRLRYKAVRARHCRVAIIAPA